MRGPFFALWALLSALACIPCLCGAADASLVLPLDLDASKSFGIDRHVSGRALQHETATYNATLTMPDHVHSPSEEDGHNHDHGPAPANGTETHDEHDHVAPATASSTVIDNTNVSTPSTAAGRTVVKTPQELQQAVQRGDVHIEVQEHLDLTGLEMIDCGGGVNCLLGQVPKSVKTIRVRSFFILYFRPTGTLLQF
jgi:hypothetical protein